MVTNTTHSLTASCDDLMLAKECIADLRGGNFGGEAVVRSSAPTEVLDGRALQAYGDDLGGLVGRGIVIGGVLGLTAGLVTMSLIDLGLRPAASVLGAVALGAVSGGVAGRSAARRRRARLAAHERDGRFVLRCNGSPEEIGAACEILQASPCRNVQVHEHAG